ncbi:MAG: DMT family transporter [Alkalispirochaeta sp.]
MKPHPLLIQLAMLTTMVLWGVSFVASKIVLDRIGPLPYMGFRFLLAAGILAVVLIAIGPPRFSRRTHGMIALTALAEPIAYFLFESYGLSIVGATTTSLIIALVPLAVMIMAAIFLGEAMHLRGVVAVVISIAGIALLVFGEELLVSGGAAGDALRGAVSGGHDPGEIDPTRKVLGVLLVLGAVFSAAGYITLARSLTQKHDPIRLTILQTWWGALFFFVLWQITTPGFSTVADMPRIVWGALIFLVIGATVAAFLLYNWALKYERAATAALYINAIPVITAVTAWIVLDERLLPIQLVGAAFVLGAVRLSTWRSKVRRATTPVPEA